MNFDKKPTICIYIFFIVSWTLSWGFLFVFLPILFSDIKDYTRIGSDLLYIFFSGVILAFGTYLFIIIKDKSEKSEAIHIIKINLMKIINNKVSEIIFLIIVLSFIMVSVFGTTEIDKPLNRFEYKAVYEANLSKNLSSKQTERIEVWIKVKRNILFKKVIKLDYIYYKNGIVDYDFEEGEEPILEIGKFVPVNFYTNGKDYTWYIELTTKKISDIKWGKFYYILSVVKHKNIWKKYDTIRKPYEIYLI